MKLPDSTTRPWRPTLGFAIILAASAAPLPANEVTVTPVISSATGLAGEQTRITWPSQTGVRYRIEKSSSLSADGAGAWSTRALVEGGEWLDPESPGTRAFYRVPEPQPEVFAVSPTVLGPAGTMLTIEGQCLPPGSSLVFQVEGAAPVSVPLQPGGPGSYRALLPAGAVVPGANILSAAIRGPDEVVLLDIKENFEVTATGRASEPPPGLAPAAVARLKLKTKSNQTNDRLVVGDEECDNGGFEKRPPQVKVTWGTLPEFDSGQEPLSTLLMPALMKAKEKANRTKCGNNLRQVGLKKEEGGRHTPFHNKYRPQFFAGNLPGEVSLEHDDLILDTPAGPPIAWTRTYRSKHGGGGAGGWTSCFDIRIEPIPVAAGADATRLYLYGGDGRRDMLHRQADGTFTCTGMFREGRFNADTSFTLTFADKSQFIFCRLVGAPWSGRIGRIQDANRVGLDFTYNASSQLHTITSQFGQSLTCAYGPTGQLASLTDHTGRFVTYGYFLQGDPGGSPGDLKSVSCPQVQGQAPLTGPTTFTYSTGNTDVRLNHNLLSVTDGGGRVVAAFTYSTVTDPADIEFDACSRLPLLNYASIEFATIKIEIGAAGYKLLSNDPLGRVTECDFDLMHRCTAVREYTGFAAPGVPVTSMTNRPFGKIRATDPDFYETTFRYNADSCVTRVTHPDSTQDRIIYGRDLRKDCPVRERGNAHLITLRTAGGEERTVTCDYLPGFGTVESPPGDSRVPDIQAGEVRDCAPNVYAAGPDGGGGGSDALLKGVRLKKVIDGDNKVFSAAGKKAKAWMVNNYEVHPVFGLKTEWITSIGLPIITPKIAKESHGRWRGPDDFRVRMITSHGQEFTCDYDTRGNCTSTRTPVAGSGCDFTWNNLGQCTSCTVLNGPGSSIVEHFTYHAAQGWLIAHIQDPDVNGTGEGLNLTTTCEYDALGRITRCVDARGYDWLTDYNALDLVVREQSPPVGTGPAASRIACDCFYNAAGQLARCDFEHRDATGAPDATNPAYSAFIVYDNRGHAVRLACEQRPVNVPAVPPLLDPAPLGLENFAVTDLTYDPAGQCVRVSTPAASRGQSTDRVCLSYYDERGLQWKCHDGMAGTPGSTTVQFDYTPAGLVSRRMLLPTLPPPPPFAPDPETTWTYDGFQRVASITDPMGNVTQFEYDERGFTTVSVFGELNDVPGSAGNVLLARGRGRSAMTFGYIMWTDSHVRVTGPVTNGIIRLATKKGPGDDGSGGGGGGQTQSEVKAFAEQLVNLTVKEVKELMAPGGGGFRPAFFDIFVADGVWTSERFTPDAPAPHPTETTTVHRSPARLVKSVTCNGDTLLTCTYDTAGRPVSWSDGFVVRGTVRDQLGNVVLDSRTDLSPTAGTPSKVYSWTSIFDEMGRCVSTTDGGGNNVNWQFDSLNRTTQCTDPGGVVHRFRWDGEIAGGPGTPPVPFTCLHECDVDNDGDFELLSHKKWIEELARRGVSLVSSTDSNGYTTTYTYDSAGWLTQCDHPDGTHEVYGFDGYGRPNSVTHKDGTVVVADFDRDGRMDVVTYSGGPQGTVPVPPVDYSYDGLGECVQCDQGDSHLVFTYDSLGNQLSEHHNGIGVTRTFNYRGRSGIAYSGGARFIEDRNVIGLLVSKSAVNPQGTVLSPPVTTVTYAGHRVDTETRANGVVTTHTYRANGDPPLPGGGADDFSFDECVRTVCTNAAGTMLHATRLRRDRAQNVTQHNTFFAAGAQSPGRLQVRAFDRMHRLTRSTVSRREVAGGPFVTESDITYTLDLEGRRLTETNGVTLGLYTQNALVPPSDHQMGQYSSWPGGPLEWDDQGCLTFMSSSTGVKQFVYDSASRLVAVNDLATGQTLATYAYDATGRRTRSSSSGDPLLPPADTFFVYDGADCIQELGGDGLPNLTIATSAGFGICIISRNGTLVYPHGGGASRDGSPDLSNTPIALWPIKKGRAAEGTVFASQAGVVNERTECDHAGTPVFLTRDGVIRQGATGTLSGYDWLSAEQCSYFQTGDKVTICHRNSARYCPETGFFQGHGSVYSPQLGTGVSVQKDNPKATKPDRAMWDLAVGKKI